MNKNKYIQDLPDRFILDAYSKEEAEVAATYFQKMKSPEDFPSVERVMELLPDVSVMGKDDADRIYNRILRQDKARKKKAVPFYRGRRFGYMAAILVVAFVTGIFIFYWSRFFTGASDVDGGKAGTNKAVLTLDDGSDVILEKGKNYRSKNLKSDGEKLIYNKKGNSPATHVGWNYLTVPRGARFFVHLSDGTRVWLNSDTRIRHPSVFLEGQIRKVELLYGEAYFEVSPATVHKGVTFMVIHRDQEVKVSGTAFNIKAYSDEKNIYTTLVEGKITVDNGRVKKRLKPGEQSVLRLKNKDMIISKVNIYDETSWVDDVFSFEDKALKDIMRALARWYDMKIVFKNKATANVRFTGVLDREQNINEILLTIKNTGFINAYKIKDNRVEIK